MITTDTLDTELQTLVRSNDALRLALETDSHPAAGELRRGITGEPTSEPLVVLFNTWLDDRPELKNALRARAAGETHSL